MLSHPSPVLFIFTFLDAEYQQNYSYKTGCVLLFLHRPVCCTGLAYNILLLGYDMGFFGSDLVQPLGQMGGEISKWLIMM